VTNWKALAATARPPIPEQDLPSVIPALEYLEAGLRPLERALPPDALMWTGPEDAE